MSDRPAAAPGRLDSPHLRAAALFLLTVPILLPILDPGWIQSHEGLSYPIRQVEVLECWEQGLLSARWFPDLNYGQGYPFLSFYAPLGFFLAGLGQLAGFDLDLACKVPLIVSILVGVAGAYRLVRRFASPGAAFVATALFSYAPYRLRDIFIRGDVAEFLAMGFLPWALWAVLRLQEKRRPRDLLLVVLFGGAAILSHNILGMLTGLSMAVTGAFVFFGAPAADRFRAGFAALAAGVGTLIATAFFWVSALYEKQFVQIDDMTEGNYALDRWFVSPLDFFARGKYPGQSQELPMTYEVGWPTLVLAAIGLGLWLAGRRAATDRGTSADAPRFRATLAVGLALFLGGVFMTTAAARPVYSLFPLLEFVQFPWRFLSLVAIGGAVVGGWGASLLLDRLEVPRVRRAVAAGLVAAAIVWAMPLLGPKPNTPLPPWAVSPEEMRKTQNTTTIGEYLPLQVEERKRPRGFTEGLKFDDELGAATNVVRRAGAYDFSFTASAPLTVTLLDVYFPGWTAWRDGEEIALQAASPSGNLQLELPAGTHELRVRLEPTPVRAAARTTSLVALLLFVGIAAVGELRGRKRAA